MGQVIWKYEVLVGQPTVHEMPTESEVVLVLAPTPDRVVFWARVKPSFLKSPREFQVSGTGQEMMDNWQHVGSAAAAGGALMWHLWMRPAR